MESSKRNSKEASSWDSWSDKFILSDIPGEDLVKITCLETDWNNELERINVSWS